MLLNRGLASGWGGNLGWYRPGPVSTACSSAASASDDPVARRAARDQVGTLLESDLPILPLARIEETAVLREGWTGAAFHPRGGLDLRRIHRGSAAPTS